MTTKQIAAACRKIARHGELIRADNAAKQVIVDLRTDYGINITGVTKGKNSRQTGYDWLRDLDQIVIDPITCPNAAREFAAYEYARDKSDTRTATTTASTQWHMATASIFTGAGARAT